mmetsp:Transcript_59283/g.136889  ORF Transcript_59283/g.136889 Transcript_59283/m.136889 type:complete len:549 (+) Transcript_59283:712-2358(+)
MIFSCAPAQCAVTRRVLNTATSQLPLQWTLPASNGGCELTQVRVWIDQDGDAQYLAASDVVSNGLDAAVVQYTFCIDADPINGNVADCERITSANNGGHRNLEKGQYYRIGLEYVSLKGSSYAPWAVFLAAGVPSQMAAPSKRTAATTSLTLEWAWTSGEENGSPLRGFRVYRNTGPGTALSTTPDATCGRENSPAPLYCEITGLTSGETYTFTVTAVNEAGEGAPSPEADLAVATAPRALLAAPAKVVAEQGAVTFSWPEAGDNGNAVFNYQAEVQDVTAGTAATSIDMGYTSANPVPISAGGTVELYVGSLTVGNAYQMRVRGQNSEGYAEWSAWSDAVSAVGAPTKPTAGTTGAQSMGFQRGTGAAATADFIVVEWTCLVAGETGGADLASINYDIWGGVYGTTGSALATVGQASCAAGKAEHSQAVPVGQVWAFRIRSRNGGASTAYSDEIRLVSAAAPGVAQSLTCECRAAETVFTWLPPTDTGGAAVLEYTIDLDSAEEQTVGNTVVEYTWTTVHATAVPCRVKASNAIGEGAWESVTCTVV